MDVERGSVLEQGEMFKKATSDIVRLYVKHKDIDTLLGHDNSELQVQKRQEEWNNLSKEYTAYTDEITEFAERMEVVRKIDKSNWGRKLPTSDRYNNLFIGVQNKGTVGILCEILFSRMLNENDDIEHRARANEDDRMASEMGLEYWILNPKAKDITMQQVVREILKGNLSITYKQPSPKSVS